MSTTTPKTNRPTARQATPLDAKAALRSEPAKTKALAKLREFTQEREGLPVDHLIFAEEAMEKLIWFRDHGSVEVGALAQTRVDDPLYVEDLHFIEQECTAASTEFDEEAQHNYVVDMTERGLNPENFMHIWVHTHPGASATPSGTDWETFDEVFGPMPWSVMAIMGKAVNGQMYCLFRFEDEAVHIPVAIDMEEEDRSEWAEVYAKNILEPPPTTRHQLGNWSGSVSRNYSHQGERNTWEEGRRPPASHIDQLGMERIPGSTTKADRDVYKDFFGIGYQGIVPVPSGSWWDYNFLCSTCQEVWRVADQLIYPTPFAIAMERSLITYLGGEPLDNPIGIFEPLTDPAAEWGLSSPLAGLLHLRKSHPKELENYAKAFPKTPDYDADKVFHWTKGSAGNMTHCVRPQLAAEVIAEAYEKDDLTPLLYGIAASLRAGWPVSDCTQPTGHDLWQEVLEEEQLQQEMNLELYGDGITQVG